MDKIDITTQNIDELYTTVNELIDNYFTYKITAKALKNHFKRGSLAIKKFIERNDLSKINNIEKIILDIVNDRYYMEMDNVLTYESYDIKSLDSTDRFIYDNLPKSDIVYEKVLADYYRTSLGYIEEVDNAKHIYAITNNKIINEVIILSEDDIDIIKNNLIAFLSQYIVNEKVNIGFLNMDINIKDIIDLPKMKMVIDIDKCLHSITEVLSNSDYSFTTKFSNYYIWEK